MKRLITSVFLLCLVALMAGPVFAGDGDDTPRDIRVTIDPFSGVAGTKIFVSGTGADPDREVVVTLSPQPNTPKGALVTMTVDPAQDGTFSATLTVPDDIVDGRYYVRGEQFTDNGNVLQYYYNDFVVGDPDEDALLPVTGTLPGTSLTVTAALALLLVLAMVLRGLYALGTKE